MSESQRLSLLEQRVTVLTNDLAGTQKEISEVIAEMQKSMTLLMKTNQTALQSLQFQIHGLDKGFFQLSEQINKPENVSETSRVDGVDL